MVVLFIACRFVSFTAPPQVVFPPRQRQPGMAGGRRDSMQTRDQRLEWWRRGAFWACSFHWGRLVGLRRHRAGASLSEVCRSISNGCEDPIPFIGRAGSGRIQSTEFNADDWIRAAKEPGWATSSSPPKHHRFRDVV